MTGLDTAGRMLDSASRIKAVQTLIKQFEILQKKTIINRDFLDAGYFDKVSKFFDELIPFETQKSYVKNNGRLFSTVLGSFTHLFNPLAGLTTGLGLDFLDKKFQSNVATAEFNLKPLLEQR